jgi:hypothetical protein
MSSPRFACLAPLLLLLTTRPALADGPPAASVPAPEAPPVAAPAPPRAYLPPPVYLPYAPPPGWSPPVAANVPYTPMKRRSPGMIATGVVLSSVSTVGVIAGAAVVARAGAGSGFECDFGCTSSSDLGSAYKPAGIVAIAVGVAAGAIGFPLLIVGAQKVPDRETPALVPAVRVGVGQASAAWRF